MLTGAEYHLEKAENLRSQLYAKTKTRYSTGKFAGNETYRKIIEWLEMETSAKYILYIGSTVPRTIRLDPEPLIERLENLKSEK